MTQSDLDLGDVAAFAGERCVGRISTCRDRLHDEFHGDRIGFFGHFEAAKAFGRRRIPVALGR